jgi:two-component system, OmpR family, sensor kinase
MRSLSFKTRLWLGQVSLLAAMLALAAFGADLALRSVVLGRVDDELLSLATLESATLEDDPPPPLRAREIAPDPPSFLRLNKLVQIADLDGRVVAHSATLGSARLPTSPDLLARLRRGDTVFETVTHFGEKPIRMVSVPVNVGRGHYAVQVAMSLGDAYAALRVGRWLFLGMSLVILTVIGLTGALLAQKVLSPIDQMVRRARRIGEANLGDRLPHPGTTDEIGRLVETLNDMLGRLERSFEVRRMFSADASHELRSPLSRLRAELELALRRPRPVAEYQEVLRSCLEEVERVQGMIEELLELARIDTNEEHELAEPISVIDLVDAAVLTVRPRAQQHGVAIIADPLPDVFVNAAPAAAKVALANILDNAVKFSPLGGQVKLTASATEDEAVITVSDAGPGVSPEDAERLFQPFYRGRASRSTGVAGVGLGLAISRVLVQRQGGRIALDAKIERGAAFSMHLPRASRLAHEDELPPTSSSAGPPRAARTTDRD